MFLYSQKRLPRRTSGLVNDYLYFLKTSSDFMDIFRQLTSDKIMMKDFVRDRCGDGFTLPLMRIFESIEDIDLSGLTRPCVIKPAHGSGSVVFVDEGQAALSSSDIDNLRSALQTSPYSSARERNYMYLRPRLICEPMLPSGAQTKDYKVFCYRGEPRSVQVDSDRYISHRRNIYSSDWSPIEVCYNFSLGEWEPAPECLSEMMSLSRQLAQPFEFVRVDFFISEGKPYVGELTHCPEAAHGRFRDRQEERIFSEILFGAAASQ